MARLLIIAHAPLASALKAVAAHTFPEEADKLRVLDVLPDMPGEEIESLARALLPAEDDVSDSEALVLCDVFGAGPPRAAVHAGDLLPEVRRIEKARNGLNGSITPET